MRRGSALRFFWEVDRQITTFSARQECYCTCRLLVYGSTRVTHFFGTLAELDCLDLVDPFQSEYREEACLCSGSDHTKAIFFLQEARDRALCRDHTHTHATFVEWTSIPSVVCLKKKPSSHLGMTTRNIASETGRMTWNWKDHRLWEALFRRPLLLVQHLMRLSSQVRFSWQLSVSLLDL